MVLNHSLFFSIKICLFHFLFVYLLCNKERDKHLKPKNMFLYNSEIERVYRESVKRNSDQGSCVMGYKLLMNGQQVVPQPFQGSSGCYNVYQDVTNFLVDKLGYGKHTITIDYGVMD